MPKELEPKIPDWLKCETCGNTDPSQFHYAARVTEIRRIRVDENGVVFISKPDYVDDDETEDERLECKDCLDAILLPSEGDERHEFWNSMEWE